MPGSPKGPKGKKLTKAEKERLKKEEEDKKAKEEGECEEDEEELRLRAERDAQEQKEREKYEAEERRRLENEEKESVKISPSNDKDRAPSAKSQHDKPDEPDSKSPDREAPSSRRSSVARNSAKPRSASARSKSGSAKSKLGSAKSKAGSAKSRSGSAKSKSGSPEEGTSEVKPDNEESTPLKEGAKEKNETDGNASSQGVKTSDGQEGSATTNLGDSAIAAPESSRRRKSTLIPKDERGESQLKSRSGHREERHSAVLREEAKARALEAQRKAEYEKELQELLERERKRRKGQLLELDQIWETNRTTLKIEHAERRKIAKWDRYMRCDGSPDPTIQGEINTYMNLWKEDMHSNDIASVLKESRLTLSLIDELNFLIEDTPPEELLPEEVTRYKDTIDELQSMLHGKLELASHDLLMKATELSDSETSNLQQVIDNDMISLCMWGNLSKNPRIKQFEFEKKGFTFDIPKVLCLSDCAVRTLFTKFDHLSPQSRTYLPRQKRKIEGETSTPNSKRGSAMGSNNEEKPEEATEEEPKEGAEAEEAPKEEGEGEAGDAPKDEPELEREDSEENSKSQMETLPSDDEDRESSHSGMSSHARDELVESVFAEGSARSGSQRSGSTKSTDSASEEKKTPEPKIRNFFDVMAALKELEGGPEKTDEEKIEEELEEEYDIKTPEPVEWEDFEGDEDAVDLRANHIMGGIFHFNLLQMPHQPKQVRNWVIVQVEEPPRLNYMEYVADGAAPPTSAKPKEEKDAPEEEGKKREERPAIGVTIRLPEDVYFCEEPQVVRWNDESKEWRLDGFSDHVFNEENRILNFKTNYFGTMALIQDAHINMPFQSWEIRPHKTNSAIFTVIAAIVEVEIEIKDGFCSLNIPEDRTELEHLRDVWLPPKEFVKRMRACGMNIFPAIDSSKYVSVQNKNPVTEDRLYQQMALTASSMAYSWSKWNSDVKDDGKVVIQGTEHLEDEPLLEVGMPRRRKSRKQQAMYSLTKMEDWSLFLVTKKRVTKLKMTEFDEKFSEDHAEGTEFHADLYHTSTEIMSEAGKDRVNDTSHAFVDCVYQLLSATKIVTYS